MTESDEFQDLSQDGFLGGRIGLWQPASGYRAGVDPVLLASAVTAEPGQRVLDLGCGAGAVMLCLAARVPGLELVGVERQPAYAALARRNVEEAEAAARIFTADLGALPDDLRAENFDHVVMNPPYHAPASRSPARDPGREAALAEDTPLATWVDVATRRLKPRGYLWTVLSAERLPDLLGAFDERLGSVVVKPVLPRQTRAATLVLVAARKGGRGAFRLAAPLVMHRGPAHERDGEDYTPEARAVLADGIHLPLW